MNNRAGWLALIVLAIASLLMVFFVLPRIDHDAKPIGDAINAAGTAVKDAVTENKEPAKAAEKATEKTAEAAKPDAQAKPLAATGSAPAAQTADSQAAAPKSAKPVAPASQASVTPSFDILRVEPDGSTVIAGRAQPHASLEVTDGSSVVAKVNVGPSGDFAAILDKPLPPGDHQLQLKATGKDGKPVVSEETATVSVPNDKSSGKLLALVTTPGKASRVIAVPQADAAKPAATGQAPAAGTMAAAPGASVAGANPAAGQGNGSEEAAKAGAAGTAQMAAATPVVPQGSGTIAATPPAAFAAPDASGLKVTAVELEGDKIFIAGTAKGGTTVRGYADDKPVGQARTGSDGHFVIDGNASLTIGDHKISVEAVSGTGQGLVRVEVPFNRPAGEQVAAVAGPTISSPMAAIDGGAFDKLRNEVVRAFNILQGLYANGKLPSLEQMVAARSATSISLKSLTEYRLPAGASVAARSLADNAAKDASTAVTALDKVPGDVASVGEALPELSEMIARAVGPAIAQQMTGTDMAAAAPAAGTDAAGTGAKTIQQAPLTQSARNSVIIRQGDTLWQISRRVYGQGVRYTTIYLANEDQIRNPDVIQPGQIFGVPGDFRPDSEELHRERLMHKRG